MPNPSERVDVPGPWVVICDDVYDARHNEVASCRRVADAKAIAEVMNAERARLANGGGPRRFGVETISSGHTTWHVSQEAAWECMGPGRRMVTRD
jgi:hypothetical protein